VELAYAETIHAAQGRTVDHALVVIDGPVEGSAVYVGLTRGRRTNHAYVTTQGDQRAIDVLDEALARSWGDLPATEIGRELTQAQPITRKRPSRGRSR
jgi:ATP-dependent exoDNAse (exonuclease V) alpha subunit